MHKLVTILLLLLFTMSIKAQVLPQKGKKQDNIESIQVQDTVRTKQKVQAKENGLEKPKAKIQDYLIISHERDTTYLDTSLTIQKEYKFNYLRKDNFGLIPFSNLGQTYNSLTHNFANSNAMPLFGARARHFNYMEIEDINYYHVPTPLTELFFKTAFEQGQLADSFFTVNTSPQFNFSIAYKGLRSLGKYQNILTSTGNFRFTSSYTSKNKRYFVRGHMVTQDLLNQENGGLQDDNVVNFESGDQEFIDRSILEVNFEDAESILKGKRFHLDHGYTLLNKSVKAELPETLNDSTSKSTISINHIMSFEDKFYEYNQANAETDYFGEAFETRRLKDKGTLENFYNKVEVDYFNNVLGRVKFNINTNNYNYGYNKLVVLNGSTITNRLKGNIVAVGGNYSKRYKGFQVNGALGVNVSGDFDGNYLKANAIFNLNNDISASASINHSSKVPNYNTLLYQSDYINYNWQNNFNNIETQQIGFNLKYKNLANITLDYSTIDNYVYFQKDAITLQVAPFQNTSTINYLRVKLANEIKFGKFALNNTILYQNVKDDNNTLNVPEFNTRNTIYFSSPLFKNALNLQTGVTLNYFTKYYMDAYNPVLAEFYVQNDTQYGNFPRLDFFLNAKIRQTRIYFKAEHFNAAFTGYNYYSAPNYPYRDFSIRFGVVWNFFL
ncbi:putative porin [Algibacter pectinivorans]|uniref:Putative porin n=1 Tax=Algibacter pectinivorans TaxID=870482 RepID=A0A1I1PVB5_9FLAO|nr:putative porin [Algibacter pectinivorans]SFD13705.1 Putative porin [Algibacter pectinivorans]